jgi:5-methylcytosine-specific restriction endonuclease McrA
MTEQCPECSREFDTENGLNSHIGLSHPSLKREIVNCEVCGSEKEIPQCQYEKADRFFCGSDCRGEWVSENNTGKSNPSWGGGKVEIECKYCGERFKVTPALVETRKHCSVDCYADTISTERVGENAPNYQGGKDSVVCEVCGDEFMVKKARNDVARFCSYDCAGEVYSESMAGPNSPVWKDSDDPYYGPNWDERKKERLEIDGHTCQSCGDCCLELEKNFPIHHITPIRDFVSSDGETDYESANKMDNLITLCWSCHPQWEGLYLRPDTR